MYISCSQVVCLFLSLLPSSLRSCSPYMSVVMGKMLSTDCWGGGSVGKVVKIELSLDWRHQRQVRDQEVGVCPWSVQGWVVLWGDITTSIRFQRLAG